MPSVNEATTLRVARKLGSGIAPKRHERGAGTDAKHAQA
jgi:hypothetical protein